MNETKLRLIYGFIGAIITITALFFGGIYFTIFLAIINSFALVEYLNFKKSILSKSSFIISVLWSLALLFTVYYLSNNFTFHAFFLSFTALLLILWLSTIITYLFSKNKEAFNVFNLTSGAIFYITFPIASMILIRNFHFLASSELFEGSINLPKENIFYFKYLLSALLSIWLCDSAAYFIGSKWGHEKLFPTVSPKKTRLGSFAGLVTAIITYIVFSQTVFTEISISIAILLGLILGTTSQIGDLFESKLKRNVNVKDSSNLIPGHGGILDRLDSLLFIFPILLVFLLILPLI